MHLEKLDNGRWRAIVQTGGRRRSVTARTRAEAQAAGAELLLELGSAPKPSDLTAGSVLAAFIAEQTPRWSPTTLADRTAAAKLIPDTFLARTTDTITVPVVRALHRELARNGVTPHRVHRACQLLGSAFANAIRHGIIPGPNPFHLSPAPAPPKAAIRVPDLDQVRRLLSTGDLALFLRVAATTAARRGEMCGLQWADIDFERNTVSIRRSIVQVAGHELVERPTKTGTQGQRVVTLDPRTVAMLEDWRTAQWPAPELMLPDPVWVFSDDHGQTPWHPNAITNRFDHHRDKVGAPNVRLHDLRHYVATTLLQDGVSPHDVANQLGHASTSTTLNVYAHYVPGRNREAIDRLAGRLDRL